MFTVARKMVEEVVAIAVSSVALIGFRADSGIEVISAVALLWRLLKAGPHASVPEEGAAERKTFSAKFVRAISRPARDGRSCGGLRD